MMPPNDDDIRRAVMAQLAADFAAGKTLGALHERLSEHREEFRRHVEDDDELRRDVQTLREDRARTEGREEARRGFGEPGPTGTGRFNIVPMANGQMHVEAIPPPPIVAVNVNGPPSGHGGDREHEHHRHASLRPIVLPRWLSRALRTSAGKVIALVLAALVGALAHHFGITLTASTRELPPHETPRSATP